jgi:hypothetical protein
MKRIRTIPPPEVIIIPIPNHLYLVDKMGQTYSMELHIIPQQIPKTLYLDHIYNKNLISLVDIIDDPTNDENIRPLKQKKKSTVVEKNDTYYPLAEYLSNIIKHKKNITHTTRQKKAWANDIRKLADMNKISYERIETALQWYRKNIGGEWIPIIESGSSLREKFIKLEGAMERDNRPFKPKEYHKDIIDDGIRYVWNEKKGKYVHSVSGEIYIP